MSQQHYAGGHVDMSPVLDASGNPLRMADPMNPLVTYGEVFTVRDQDTREDRAVMKRRMALNGYTVTNPETSETVNFYWEDLYRRPDGSLYHHRVEASEGMQTVGRYEAIGGGRQRDLYLGKPGWRWAKAADVVAALAKADKNAKDQDARTLAKDPLEANKMLANTLASAIASNNAAQAQNNKRGGGNQ